MAASGESPGRPADAPLSRWEATRDTAWRLVVSTVGTCFRNRVTGLAAEAAFFALLSLPPLIFGLAGSIGYVFDSFSEAQVQQVRDSIIELASRALTESTVDTVITPTLNDVLGPGRFDVISIGFILALWSGSRALNVFVDTITIMYGLGGHRGVVKTRMLSFSLYVMGLITGVVTLPLVVAGPRLVDKVLPPQVDVLNELYWPTVILLTVFFLATLYHVSVPVRTSWRYNLPGAALTMVIWIFGSYLLRWVLTVTAGESTSIYGPLAAPIIVLLWLYLLSIAVLIGAAVNAAFDRVWPESETARARMELVRRLRLKAMIPRLRRLEEEQQRFPEVAEETMVLRAYDEGRAHDEQAEALDVTAAEARDAAQGDRDLGQDRPLPERRRR